VAKERLKSPRTRLFVALDLPATVRQGIAEWGKEELTDPALRRVPTEMLHVTLAFLGWRWERDIETAAAILQQVGGDAPRLRLGAEPVAVPPRKRTRLYALDAPSEETIALQAEVEGELVAARLYEPEKRPFWSHVTVARVRKERGAKRQMRVERPPGAIPDVLLEPFFGVRLTLYRSVLRPAGAEYTPLAQVELPPDEAAVR
jgi:RNA 2',3'-cyclic 3'-phosphodiesterase